MDFYFSAHPKISKLIHFRSNGQTVQAIGPSIQRAQRLSTQDAYNLGFPSLGLSTVILGRSWDASVYAALRQFHQAKGFDPDSARYLGHPLYELSIRFPRVSHTEVKHSE
jgi:hypothetical protein